MTNDVRTFLEKSVAWPKPEETGFISLHTSDNWAGVATRNIGEFLEELEKARERTTDIYICTARQTEAKQNGGTRMTPIRKGLNASFYRSIWIDWDAGPDKQFKTSQEAAAGLKKFLADSALPGPSAIVASGSGGFHCWWWSDRPLIKGIWEIYSRGLKGLLEKHGFTGDVGCTTDFVRILRVPGTVNTKHTPARNVTLLAMGKEYDFEAALPMVLAAAGSRGVGSPTPPGKLPLLPARFVGRKDAIVVAAEDLPPGFPPMPAEQLRECLDAIPNDKPSWDRWNTIGMRVYAACDGEDYGLPEWQRWSDTLVVEGKDSCESRWNTYHTSPPTRTGAGALVNEVRRITGSEAWLPASRLTTPAPVKKDDDSGWRLPNGYRLKDSRIERLAKPKKGDDDDDGSPWRPFIKNEIIGRPWAQKGPDGLMLTIRIDVATTREVFIASTDCPRTKIMQKMCELGIWYDTYTQAMHFEDFFMSWIGRMNSYVAANEKAGFGWEWKNPKSKLPTAFVYGGLRYKNDGSKEPVGAVDASIREEYYPQGTREAWDEAAKVIFDQKRPALELIVAATLAGPLVQFTGVEGCMLSVFSNSSGAHKSTASKLGAAIFGHPVDSRQTKGSSMKGALKRAGDLRHLTIQFDDLQDDKDMLTGTLVALQLAQGHEGDKLTQKREHAHKGKWQTFALTLSNKSVIDFVIQKEPNTPAQLNRIFEVYHRKQANDDPGMIDEGVATRLIGELNRNFGRVGEQYAELLVNNVDTVDAVVKSEQNLFRATIVERGIEGDSANRYWMFTCSVLLAAAKLGRELGIPFDYDGIRALLVQSFLDNTAKRTDAAVDGESSDNTELAISEFLNTIRATNVLWTDHFALRGGIEDKIREFGTPPVGRTAWVHFSTKGRLVRISQKEFGTMLRAEKRSLSVVKRGLKTFFNADDAHRYTLGAGTSFAGVQEKVIEIPIPEGSPFETMMFAHGGKTDDQI